MLAAIKPVAPFVRPFAAGASGPDVKAVKRALIASGYGKGILVNGTFGAQASHDLEQFQRLHRLTASGKYDAATHRALTPWFDQYGCSLIAKEAIVVAAQKKKPVADSVRAAYVKTYEWGIANHAWFDYVESRPMPLQVEKADLAAARPTQRIRTDCSGWVTGAAYLTPGCPDPNGLKFNGEGFTGTILSFCQHVPFSQMLPGDLIVYGPLPSGFHVSVAIAKQPNGDWMTGSNGHQGAPAYQLHSGMAQWQAANGHPGVTVCRFLHA